MSPQEKSLDMVEAIKYNLANGLMTPEEVRSAKTPQEKSALAMKALLNRKLHGAAEKQKLENIRYPRRILKMESYQSMTDEEIKDALENGRVIWRKP